MSTPVIYQLPTPLTGSVGVLPVQKYMVVGDNLATVTTAGYLNSVNLESYPIASTDIINTLYSFNPNTQVGTFEQFSVTISAGVITLVALSAAGEVTLPTIANHIATYTNTLGHLSEDPATAISGGNIQAGLSGTAGYLASFPATMAKGSLRLTAVANTGDTLTTISNAAMGQASVISVIDPGASTANFILSATAGSIQHITSGNLGVDAGVLISGLATGGSTGALSLFPTTASKGYVQYSAAANTGNTAITITNAAFGQVSALTIPDPGTATADFALAPAALVNNNLVKASGTAGLIADSGISSTSISGAITQLGQLYQVSVTFNTAQMVTAYDTPLVIVAAPGATKMIQVVSASVYTASTGNTAYATGTAPIIQYGATAHGAGTSAVGAGLVAGDITAATSQVRTLGPIASSALTGTSNQAITFSNATGDYTGGTGTNITITLVYQLLTATV